MAKFHFTDLHGFKDYVVFVKLCAPDEFPARDGYGPDEQWTLDLAFEGLREGLKMAIEEKGDKPVFAKCRELVGKAYEHYREGKHNEGYFALEEVRKLLRKVPTQ